MLALALNIQPAKAELKTVSLECELGIWYASSGCKIPDEAGWVVASLPDYEKPRVDISVILDWYRLHPPYGPFNPFETVSEIKQVEEGLKSVQTENFWGIIFICEEHYRVHVGFNDDVDTTWFGERLLGYPLYLQEDASATLDEWKDEMFLRMIRGFYNYFHEKGLKVGVTMNAGALVVNLRGQSWSHGIPKYWGQLAFDFIKNRYDFVILYAYTRNLEDFQWTKEYFSLIDQHFQKQKKLWILTRIWDNNREAWEREAIALEIKNCLDRNIAVTSYRGTEPPFEETWALMKKAVELYYSDAPFFETYVYGKNLMTGYVGNTYGWVKV